MRIQFDDTLLIMMFEHKIEATLQEEGIEQ
jgi:hypothetical protein